MAPEIPPERLLDRITRIDELLAMNLEATRKLTEAIERLTAAPPPVVTPPAPPPRVVVAPAAPPELAPLAIRLDNLAVKLDDLAAKLDKLAGSVEEYSRHDIQGKPVAFLGRYSGTDTTYQKIEEWRVGDVWGLDKGNLTEISVVCEIVAMYAHAQFKLTIEGKPIFKDKKVVTALTFPFPNNQLLRGKKVTLEVKSDDGTLITVDGTIMGKEI